ILYEMLAGHPPIQGETDIDTLKRVLTDDPADLRKVRPDVPPDLEAICLKCLEKRPEARYSTAADLADDLERFSKGLPVRARHVGVLTRVTRRAGRQPRSVKIAAGVVSAMWCVTAFSLWNYLRIQDGIEQSAAIIADLSDKSV